MSSFNWPLFPYFKFKWNHCFSRGKFCIGVPSDLLPLLFVQILSFQIYDIGKCECFFSYIHHLFLLSLKLCNYYYGNRAPQICFQNSPMFFWRLYSADCAETVIFPPKCKIVSRNCRFSSKMQNGVPKLCRNRRFSSKMQNGVQKLCRNLHFTSKMQNQALILCIKSIPSGGHAKYTFIQKTALLHRCFFTYFAALFFSLWKYLLCLADRILYYHL